MPYRVEFTKRAERDFESLHAEINANDSIAAVRWFDGLEELVMRLERLPKLGMPTKEDMTIRQLIYGKKPHFYKVLYEINIRERIVTILHVRHGKRLPFKRM